MSLYIAVTECRKIKIHRQRCFQSQICAKNRRNDIFCRRCNTAHANVRNIHTTLEHDSGDMKALWSPSIYRYSEYVRTSTFFLFFFSSHIMLYTHDFGTRLWRHESSVVTKHIQILGVCTYQYFFSFFLFIPYNIFVLLLLFLLVATQIRGHILQQTLLLLPTTVRALHFYRETIQQSSFFPRRLGSNCPYPRQALSAFDPFFSSIFANKLEISPTAGFELTDLRRRIRKKCKKQKKAAVVLHRRQCSKI